MHRFRPPVPAGHSIRPTVRQDLLSKCQEKWRNATLDHFTFVRRRAERGRARRPLSALRGRAERSDRSRCAPNPSPNSQGKRDKATPDTFLQRYFLCDSYWQPGGPMFFYLGNEADVEL